METTTPADRAAGPEARGSRHLETAPEAESVLPREREYLREHIVLGYN
ncbi:hypothetical protein [Amycolatopsis sp. DG1A-15b]|nr:hypothetical protein [Amycolatopsis sp. DG1A-15b]WIX84519.1 hypothetical protein QRY02_25015 [Amycolatopsis sp. DG1A-15b]